MCDNIVSEGQWAKDSAGYEFIVRGEDHLIVKPGQPPRRARKVGNHGVLHVRALNALEKERYLTNRRITINDVTILNKQSEDAGMEIVTPTGFS
jgi:hypothetical protein